MTDIEQSIKDLYRDMRVIQADSNKVHVWPLIVAGLIGGGCGAGVVGFIALKAAPAIEERKQVEYVKIPELTLPFTIEPDGTMIYNGPIKCSAVVSGAIILGEIGSSATYITPGNINLNTNSGRSGIMISTKDTSSISIKDETGMDRMVMGAAVLTNEQQGGTEITPESCITMFDKSGKVTGKYSRTLGR